MSWFLICLIILDALNIAGKLLSSRYSVDDGENAGCLLGTSVCPVAVSSPSHRPYPRSARRRGQEIMVQ